VSDPRGSFSGVLPFRVLLRHERYITSGQRSSSQLSEKHLMNFLIELIAFLSCLFLDDGASFRVLRTRARARDDSSPGLSRS